MAKPISIDFTADTRQVLRETENLADGFDQVSDSLKDLAKDAARSGDQVADALDDAADGSKDLERGLERGGDAARDAAKDVDRLEGALDKGRGAAQDAAKSLTRGMDQGGDAARKLEADVDKAFDQISDQARTKFKDAGDSAKRGFAGASEGVQELKDEADGTAREVAASFDGSAESIAEGFQEVAANALAGFGPLGAVAGLALAAGLGSALAFLNGEADRINEIGEAVADLAGELDAAGGALDTETVKERMREWGLEIQDTREWWEVFQESAKSGLKVIQEESEAAGLHFGTAFKGAAGDLEDSERALRLVEARIESTRDNATTYVDAATGMTQMDLASKSQLSALESLRDRFKDNIQVQAGAAEQQQLLEDAGVQTTESLEAQAEAVDQANQALLEHADALDRAAGRNIGAAEAELRLIETLGKSSETIAENGKNIDVHTEAGRANQGALLDLASASNDYIDKLIEQGGSTADVTAKSQAARDAFITAATSAGYGADEAKRLADQYGLVPKNVATKVEAHGVREAEGQINHVARNRSTSVAVTADTSSAAWTIDQLSGRTIRVNADVAVRPGSPIFN